MKLGALRQGDKFVFAQFPDSVPYVKGGAIPGTMGERFYVHSGNVVYTGGGYFDEEVIKVNEE